MEATKLHLYLYFNTAYLYQQVETSIRIIIKLSFGYVVFEQNHKVQMTSQYCSLPQYITYELLLWATLASSKNLFSHILDLIETSKGLQDVL